MTFTAIQNDIYADAKLHLTRWQIIEGAKRDEESPLGYLITYIIDNYGIPKTVAYPIAEQLCEDFLK